MIVPGALGSGLWESALKPTLVHASYGLMSLSSLGIESVRTGIYERIATGSTSRASVLTLGQITLLTVSLYALMFTYFLLKYGDLQSHQKRLDGRAGAEHRESLEELIQQMRKLLKLLQGVLYRWGFLILLLSGMLLVDLSRTLYENAAVVYFQQAPKPSYLRLIITAVRSSCCLVPPEKSTTALWRAEMMSPGDLSLDARTVSSNLLEPNCSLCALAHS